METTGATGADGVHRGSMEMRLAIVVLPVGQVDRAKAFYRAVGFREDLDYASGAAFRIVRFTPPGSVTAIVFGTGITAAVPGSVQGLVLAVRDVVAARADLVARGVAVSDVFHDRGGVFFHGSPLFLEEGPDPGRRDHATFARFCDPDGNGWVIEEVDEPVRSPEAVVDPWPDPWSPRARRTTGPGRLRPVRGRIGSRERRST